MGQLAASINYARDVGEVLIVQRVRATPDQGRIAGEAATVVRQARFHAHARIPECDLSGLLARLGGVTVSEVTLPGPTARDGVGGAAYYHALGSVVRALAPRSILEFGTYLGLGTLTMALNAPDDCSIVTLDLPDDALVDDEHELNAADLDLIERRRHRTGEAFLESRVADRITQLRADSLTWQPPEGLGPFDLILIDGGHSRPVVKADTENSQRLLAPGGTILWDDYFHLYPDVVDYLDEFANDGQSLSSIRGTNLVIANDRLA